MESSSSSQPQPTRRGRGRPPKEKAPKPPPRPRGRPRKRSKEEDMPPPAAAAAAPPPAAAAPPFVHTLDSTLTDIKAVKDISHDFKKTVQDLSSSLASLFNKPGQMLTDLCNAHFRENEYHSKVQNANQDFHGTFRVYVRVKPALPGESVVEFAPENDPQVVKAPSSGATKAFGKLNGVFAKNESQEQVFNKLQPLVRRVVEGSNICLLAYGQSGSGKTYSLFGPSNKGILIDKNGGLCQLAIAEVMNLAVGWNFRFTMEEVMEKGKTVYLSEPHTVNDLEDLITRLEKGFKLRACTATNLNQQRSRSHCIVKLELQQKDANDEIICGGRLYMVDLAGSEKVSQSKVQGSDLKKTSTINTSLLHLKMVMQKLSENADHVPFHNNVLTLHLKDCLDTGGNSKVVVLAHVSPLEKFYNETTSTLEFAQMTASVRNGVLQSQDRKIERLELMIKKHTTSLQSPKIGKLP